MGFWNNRHQVRSKSKDLKVKLTSLSHNLHFELYCISLRKLHVVIQVLHVYITIFGVVIRSLWTKNDLIYKARGRYYIQSLMKIVAIPDVWHFIHYTNIHGIIRHVYGLLKIIVFQFYSVVANRAFMGLLPPVLNHFSLLIPYVKPFFPPELCIQPWLITIPL